jgi:hypothetical protein
MWLRPRGLQPHNVPRATVGWHGCFLPPTPISPPTWVDMQQLLWLWPLPPAQTFDLVFQWPVAGIAMTRVPIDGAAVVEAAGQARPFIGR